MRILQGVKQTIAALAFSPDGLQLAVAGSVENIYLWEYWESANGRRP
jgi:hypothetical protein